MFLNTAIAACLLFYCVTTAAILPPSTTRQQAIFWHRCYCSYIFIPPVFHYLFAELVHLLGVLGTQETSCFVVAGLHERDIFDLFLPEFDKPWVIHLRENLLLFYKPLLLEAQHCLQERRGNVDISGRPPPLGPHYIGGTPKSWSTSLRIRPQPKTFHV